MTFGDAIFKILSNDSGVSNIVGTKIFPGLVAQGNDLPAIVYNIDYKVGFHCFGSDPDYYRTNLKILCIDYLVDDTENLKEKVLSALKDFRGVVTVGEETLTITRSFFESEEQYEDLNPETNKLCSIIELEFTIWWGD